MAEGGMTPAELKAAFDWSQLHNPDNPPGLLVVDCALCYCRITKQWSFHATAKASGEWGGPCVTQLNLKCKGCNSEHILTFPGRYMPLPAILDALAAGRAP